MVKKLYNKKAQSYSTDILVVVIIILFGTLFLVMTKVNNEEINNNLDQKYEEAILESKIIVDHLKAEEIISSENKINVENLLSLNEEQLKEELGIKNDFAIVFEKDGKLVKIDPNSDLNCIGSSKIIVNGQNCK